MKLIVPASWSLRVKLRELFRSKKLLGSLEGGTSSSHNATELTGPKKHGRYKYGATKRSGERVSSQTLRSSPALRRQSMLWQLDAKQLTSGPAMKRVTERLKPTIMVRPALR